MIKSISIEIVGRRIEMSTHMTLRAKYVKIVRNP